MENVEPKPPGELTREELRELYGRAIDQLRYMHGDLWRAQQFYTSLSVGIIGAALAISRLSAPGATSAAALLLIVGFFVSLSAIFVVLRIRETFLEAGVHKTYIEHLLGYRDPSKDWTDAPQLAVQWTYRRPSLSRILDKPVEWVAQNRVPRGSVTMWFIVLLILFAVIDVALALALASWGV